MLLDAGGSDATESFEDAGHSDDAKDFMAELKVGVLEGWVRIPMCMFWEGWPLLFPCWHLEHFNASKVLARDLSRLFLKKKLKPNDRANTGRC